MLKRWRVPKPRLKLPKVDVPPQVLKIWRNQRVRHVAVAALSAGAVMALGWWAWSNSSFAKLEVKAAAIEGTVEYRVAYEHPWERVQRGMSFGEGAQLRSADGSRAEFVIGDGSVVRLNSSSSITLTKLAPRHIIVENTGGELYARVAENSKRQFQVRAGSATYEARGTAYRTFNTDAKEGVEVYHGSVAVLGVQADGAVIVEQGQRYFVADTDTGLVHTANTIAQTELSEDDFLRWNSERDRRNFANAMGVLEDITPPELIVRTPVDGTETTEASITVSGTTEAGAIVLVNNVGITNDNGVFERTVDLALGANTIIVESTDKAGNKTTKTLTVSRAEPIVFRLSGTTDTKGVKLSWEVSGLDVSGGFRIVTGKDTNPVYDKKKTSVPLDSSQHSYTWPVSDGKTYHFRICIWDGTGCTRYSNDVMVTAPSQQVNSWWSTTPWRR